MRRHLLSLLIIFGVGGAAVVSQESQLKTVGGLIYRFDDARRADVLLDSVPYPWHIDIAELFIAGNVAEKLWLHSERARSLEIYRSVARLRCEAASDADMQRSCNLLKRKVLNEAQKRADQDGLTYRQPGNYFFKIGENYVYGNEVDEFSLNLGNPVDKYSARDISKLAREIFLTAGSDQVRVYIFSDIPADVRGNNFARYLLQRAGVDINAQKSEIVETREYSVSDIESYFIRLQNQIQIKLIRRGNKGFIVTSRGSKPKFRLLGFGY